MKGALNRARFRAGPCTGPCVRRKKKRYPASSFKIPKGQGKASPSMSSSSGARKRCLQLRHG